MNKKLLCRFAILAVGLGLATVKIPVFADDSLNSMTTEVGIGFGSYNPGNGPFQDNLALTFVPKAFNFGASNTISSNTQTYKQINLPTDGQFLGVSDDRSTKNSWNVSAMLSDFVSTTSIDDKLENASLNLTLGEVKDYNFDAQASDEAGAATPAPSETTLTELSSTLAPLYSDIAKGVITLIAGSTAEKKVLNYNLPSGVTAEEGTAAVARSITNVNLTVKGSSATENSQYKSTITWILSDDAA